MRTTRQIHTMFNPTAVQWDVTLAKTAHTSRIVAYVGSSVRQRPLCCITMHLDDGVWMDDTVRNDMFEELQLQATASDHQSVDYGRKLCVSVYKGSSRYSMYTSLWIAALRRPEVLGDDRLSLIAEGVKSNSPCRWTDVDVTMYNRKNCEVCEPMGRLSTCRGAP
jgi:hypothetical protein